VRATETHCCHPLRTQLGWKFRGYPANPPITIPVHCAHSRIIRWLLGNRAGGLSTLRPLHHRNRLLCLSILPMRPAMSNISNVDPLLSMPMDLSGPGLHGWRAGATGDYSRPSLNTQPGTDFRCISCQSSLHDSQSLCRILVSSAGYPEAGQWGSAPCVPDLQPDDRHVSLYYSCTPSHSVVSSCCPLHSSCAGIYPGRDLLGG
jgi:hypothetical protein